MSLLDDLRAKIDALDVQLLEMLETRARLAVEVAEAKRAAGRNEFYDPERERRVLDALANAAGPTLTPAAARGIFREIISACLSLQSPMAVAFLGPDGTFTSIAARKLFGNAALYRQIDSIESVFDAVVRGAASRGVVPLENSTEGTVTPTMRALLAHDVSIERQLVLNISHALLAPQASLSAVARIYSHPQALGQCTKWLAQYAPAAQQVPVASTAAAMHQALADPAGAAIGAKESGLELGLQVLFESIQDRPDNQTRFIVLSRSDSAKTGQDRTLLAFRLEDEPGVLRRALTAFDEAHVNLTRLGSFPTRERAWDYFFLCEFEGHRTDPAIAAALASLRGTAKWLKVLGSYPASDGAAPPGPGGQTS